MILGQRVVVVMPAYNAASTLELTYGEIPTDVVDQVVVVDDGSDDATVAVAERLELEVLRHPANRGYGANQKTCYRAALERGDLLRFTYGNRSLGDLLFWPACMPRHSAVTLLSGAIGATPPPRRGRSRPNRRTGGG